jgi:antitoxin component YwqK of YwqJK toxin-antitoxin module
MKILLSLISQLFSFQTYFLRRMKLFFIAVLGILSFPLAAQKEGMLYANCTEVYDKGDTSICIEQYDDTRQLIRYYMGGKNLFSKRYAVESNGDYSFQEVIGDFDSPKNGVGYYYYRNTQLKMVLQYSNEKLMNCSAYYDVNGKPLALGTLQNGNGTLINYDENGKILTVLKYKKGKKRRW